MDQVKELFAKYKIYIIAAVLVVVGAFGALSFMGGGAGAVDPAVQGGAAAAPIDSASAQAEKEMLDELLQLRSIRLSESLFANPLFISLVDFSKPLAEQLKGRSNPFAPITSVSEVPAEPIQ